jgi:hypothetical protein
VVTQFIPPDLRGIARLGGARKDFRYWIVIGRSMKARHHLAGSLGADWRKRAASAAPRVRPDIKRHGPFGKKGILYLNELW